MQPKGSQAITEYHNPDLLVVMYPTLFPCGIGTHYYLELADQSFCYHHSYLFEALNMVQCQAAHLQTFFTVHKSNFDDVSATVLDNLAYQLEQEHNYSQFSSEEQLALKLLRQVNTMSARIPGLQASKIYMHNEICSYFSYFGLPHFTVMFGNQTVDLSACFPHLLAQDPVAGADFFEF
ncbi:uncharacterized protein BJ212DRAFT_1449037 [Suillus subaureus]|uniref:Helitron helicase-like domain-containing protein n=1 Tax=Suillus subaureus TaxID=48587 RepID=A0A9P7J8R3_9AGAM|nr:uncharacterized protein BJ212DRAFT_1449037 [Suillus subaureus]KAG1808407.1 hypothetical protein BJ212DRAFT_1449037 [Suillus subaureus]